MDNSIQRDQLHFAARDGDMRQVRKLIDGGFPVNRFDNLGITPLHYAAAAEHFEVVEFLIRSGSDVNAHDERVAGNTPLGDVVDSCSLRMAELLVKFGSDPTIPGWMQLTALHRAEIRKKREGTGSVGQAVHKLLRDAATRKR